MIVTIHAGRRQALRTTGLFLAAVTAWAIVAAAALAAIFVVRDQLRSPQAEPSPPRADIKADGLVVLNPLRDRGAFKDALGFDPVVPDQVPETTDSTPMFFSTSEATGQIRFAPRTETSEDGLRGAAIALMETPHSNDEQVDESVKTATTRSTRIVSSSMVCSGVTVEAQLYFYSGTGDVEPTSETVSRYVDPFLAALRRQCDG